MERRKLWATWLLKRRAPREAGFTEQRLPPALCSGRITDAVKSPSSSTIEDDESTNRCCCAVLRNNPRGPRLSFPPR
ncbi:hypothetical protein GBA52_020179 [Prunus armeniaca]|nr:hypothetical protein GBA52_020179 [Prunus armeniaca]